MNKIIALCLVLSASSAFAADKLVCRPQAQNPGFRKHVYSFEITPFGRSGATMLMNASAFLGSEEVMRPVKYRLDRFAKRTPAQFVVQYTGRSTSGSEAVAVAFRTNGFSPHGSGTIRFNRLSYNVICSVE